MTTIGLSTATSLHIAIHSILYYMLTFPYSSPIFTFDMHFCFIYFPLCNSLL